MFFTADEIKIAEELAWKMYDSWNHAYVPDLDEYAHFYYKGKLILDPWMNEESQEICWPDHKNRETAVDPFEYYGQMTVECYLARLFMLCEALTPKTAERVRQNADERGRLIYTSTAMPVEVYVAMSESQAEEEHGYECLDYALLESGRIYLEMNELPKDIFDVVKTGWEREVIFRKKDLKKVVACLYPNGTDWDYKRSIDRIQGSYVRLIGYGD